MSLLNAKLSQKLAIAFAALIVTLTAAAAANWWGMAGVERASAENAATVARLNAAQAALAELVEEQNAVRGYVATLDPAFLVRRQMFHQRYLAAMAAFQASLSDPVEHSLGARFLTAAGRFERDCEQQIADARSPATLARSRAELSTIGRLFDARAVVDLIGHHERAELAALSAAQRRAVTVAGVVLGAGVLAAICLAIAMGWVLTQTVARPVAALTLLMRRLAAGDHTVSAPALERTDEVGDMARAVEAFRAAAVAKVRLEAQAVTLMADRQAQEIRAELAEEIAGVGHWRRDPHTGEGVWSRELYRIYGLDPARGAPPLGEAIELFHPDDRAEAEAALKAAADEGQGFSRDFRILRPDGEVRHIQMRAAAERTASGVVSMVFGVCLDVTEAKRAEQELRRSESRYRLLAENMTDVIAELDLNGVITFVTPACTRMLGRTPAEMLGVRMYDLMHPDDRDAINEATTAHALAGPDSAPIVIQYRALHKDGHWVWIEGQPKFTFDEQGRPLSLQDSVRDISERKAAEQRQILMMHELNHRVKNTLAAVQSVALQTQKAAEDPADFVRAFNARVTALANSHDLLTENAWAGAELRELVAKHLAAYQRPDGTRFGLAGPSVQVSPKIAVALGMALGELATNAAKYGALSTEAGRVAVTWERLAGGEADRLRLVWREEGGPPVAAPTRRGFGARLIEQGLSRELGGPARLRFEPDGLVCEIEFPLPSEADLPESDQFRPAARRASAGGRP